MGYRASIKNINSIGHLINGNICTFFEETIITGHLFPVDFQLFIT